MLRHAPVAVRIQVGSSALAEACAAALSGAGLNVWRNGDEIPHDGKIDVVLTDRAPVAGDSTSPNGGRDAGVIALGSEQGAADVALPTCASPRELALACNLLGEIVRLRRRMRTASRRRRTLSRLALTDPLTGLSNRRAWEQELAARWQTAHDAGQPLCVALYDLDHFKLVNDAYGHMVGDRLLQAAGDAIASGLRDYDLAARLGGDEFGVLLMEVSAELAAKIVERNRQHVNAALATASPMPVAASAGYVVLPVGGSLSPEALVAAADAALVAAKNSGRDRTVAAG